jgi:1-deoxy-D-xylulose-5-phosphate reductoisomerase
VLCAADEVAVELFLSHRIRFTYIAKIVQRTLEQHRNISRPSLEDVLAADDWAREYATGLSLGQSRKHERTDNPATRR